jgi:hypothetical protein
MTKTNTTKRIVVFDLDETLGYFTEFGIFCDCLDIYFKNKAYSNTNFNKLLDLYPEFLRPRILNILNYLTEKKKAKKCYKVMIYTNNQGPKSWAKSISEYFDYKTDYKLFDQIIAAFKIRGEKIELGRTSYDKTIDDLFRCTKLPEDIEICFVDDLYHGGMTEDRVYYINVKPYHHKLTIHNLMLRFLDSSMAKNIKDKTEFINIIEGEFKKYKYRVAEKSKEEQDIDSIIGKKMFQHIKRFFYENNNKTLSRKKTSNNGTLKKR